MMPCNEIYRNIMLRYIVHEHRHVFFIFNTAYGRSAHSESFIQFLYCFKGFFEEYKILFHVGILPESRKVGFIPNLNRPCDHLIGAISVHQMRKCGFDHVRPQSIILWRCNISFPVKDRLFPRCHLLWHKTKFQKRFNVYRPVTVHHKIKICKVVFYPRLSFSIGIFMIYGHIIRKQPVTSYVFKAYILLNRFKLVHIFLLKRQSHSSRSDTVIYIIVKIHIAVRIKPVFDLHLIVSFPYIGVFQALL